MPVIGRSAPRRPSQGQATDTGEHRTDLRAITVPVVLADNPIAALTLTLAAEDHDAHAASAAAALTRALGHHR